MKKDSISDYELLSLIHKNIDTAKLKKQDNTITKTRIDKLLQNLKCYIKRSKLSIATKLVEDKASKASTEPSTELGRMSLSRTSKKKYDFLIVNIDGASRGNPGKSGIGVAIYDKDLTLVKEIYEYIGIATNNKAEYTALIRGIKEAIKFDAQEILFKTDSELLVKQIMGEYRVNSTQLLYLFTEAQGILKKLQKWKIKHISRDQNKKADMLANQGIDMPACR